VRGTRRATNHYPSPYNIEEWCIQCHLSPWFVGSVGAVSWDERDGALHRTFEFADFAEAFAFMTRVAMLAERLDHHPDWSNSWNRVDIALTSHDAGHTVTERDRRMAAAIDRLVS
jgi:4a-hydroxytetrahydrobiopterin dehydratase